MSKYNWGVFAGAVLISFGLDKNLLRTLALILGIILLTECWGGERPPQRTQSNG